MVRGFGLGYGRGMGRGMGGGFGFGFRGSTPPWPYVGRGRGGLPRCGYYLDRGIAGPWPFGQQPADAGVYSSYGYPAYSQPETGKHDLGVLKEQAEMIKREIESINARICDLEKDE